VPLPFPGKLSEAETTHLEAVQGLKEFLGNSNNDTQFAMGNLASFYERQDRSDASAPLRKEVLASRTETFGAEHPQTKAADEAMRHCLAGLKP